MINHKTVVLFTAMMIMTCGLAAGAPARAQQTTTPHLDMPDASHGKQGITHRALLKTGLAGAADQEVIVWDTEYAPRGINPRHHHPVAITFHVIEGTGIWQEDGKLPVTLKAGDSLFVPAGTTHSHWNPSYTQKLRFLEFIVGEKDKARPTPRPAAQDPPHSN
jgi:quercetin dioxygenase-like cupin family protein